MNICHYFMRNLTTQRKKLKNEKNSTENQSNMLFLYIFFKYESNAKTDISI